MEDLLGQRVVERLRQEDRPLVQEEARPPVHDDLVRRVFSAQAPNQLWLADITEHRTKEGKLYLCAVKDVFSNRIVGYSIDHRMKSRIAVAPEQCRRPTRRCCGLLLHTDRGSQFRSRKLQRALNSHHMVGSMGRVGAAGDNAAMESFFSLLQKNVLNRRTWETRDEAAASPSSPGSSGPIHVVSDKTHWVADPHRSTKPS